MTERQKFYVFCALWFAVGIFSGWLLRGWWPI